MSLKTDLDKLAASITTAATDKDTPFAERLDAFKALTAYYALLEKHKAKNEDDSDGPSFLDFQSAVADTADEEQDNGRAPIRGRRRHA